MSGEGDRVGDKLSVQPRGDGFEVMVPESALTAALDYLVVRIVVRRDHVRAPRAFAVHFRTSGDRLTLVGLRH